MNNKYTIVALFGKAGAGKDYLLRYLKNTIWGKTHCHEIISNTTRPPREGEKDGVHYHFLPSSEDFLTDARLKNYLEFTMFNGWWYGTSIEHLKLNKINIGVFNINGISQLLDNKDCHIIPICITAIDKLRLIRQLEREDNPNCLEICRRFQTDEKDFLNIPFSYSVVENNFDEAFYVTKEIIAIIDDKVKLDSFF